MRARVATCANTPEAPFFHMALTCESCMRARRCDCEQYFIASRSGIEHVPRDNDGKPILKEFMPIFDMSSFGCCWRHTRGVPRRLAQVVARGNAVLSRRGCTEASPSGAEAVRRCRCRRLTVAFVHLIAWLTWRLCVLTDEILGEEGHV